MVVAVVMAVAVVVSSEPSESPPSAPSDPFPASVVLDSVAVDSIAVAVSVSSVVDSSSSLSSFFSVVVSLLSSVGSPPLAPSVSVSLLVVVGVAVASLSDSPASSESLPLASFSAVVLSVVMAVLSALLPSVVASPSEPSPPSEPSSLVSASPVVDSSSLSLPSSLPAAGGLSSVVPTGVAVSSSASLPVFPFTVVDPADVPVRTLSFVGPLSVAAVSLPLEPVVTPPSVAEDAALAPVPVADAGGPDGPAPPALPPALASEVGAPKPPNAVSSRYPPVRTRLAMTNNATSGARRCSSVDPSLSRIGSRRPDPDSSAPRALLLCHPSGHPLLPPSLSLSLMLESSFRYVLGVDTHGYSTDTYYTDGRDHSR